MASEQREQMGYELSALANAAAYKMTDVQIEQLKLKVSRAFADLEEQLAQARALLEDSLDPQKNRDWRHFKAVTDFLGKHEEASDAE